MILQQRLEMGEILSLAARVSHVRTGRLRHAFRYGADFVLLAPEHCREGQAGLRRNRFGVFSVHDRDHGGQGEGAARIWAELEAAEIVRRPAMTLALLTQPRFMGFGFNPVSFWFVLEAETLLAVVAEVNNTWGERHSYLCLAPEGQSLSAGASARVEKLFHVSPFQDLGGSYRFRFSLTPDRADILICHEGPEVGLVARMQGAVAPLRRRHLLAQAFKRPGGALRVVALIYFHALQLKLRGARWRHRPSVPAKEFTQ